MSGDHGGASRSDSSGEAPPLDLDGQPTGLRLYIYYRVAQVALHEVLPRVQAMQAVLRQAAPGLVTGLLRRTEVREGQVTLMETYTGAIVAAGFEPVLAGAAQAAGLVMERKVERFTTLDDLLAPADPV